MTTTPRKKLAAMLLLASAFGIGTLAGAHPASAATDGGTGLMSDAQFRTTDGGTGLMSDAD